MKIRGIIGTVRDLIIFESSGREEGHINVLVEFDLNKLLLRGIKLRYKKLETWVEFKYEQLLIFCYYCGKIGHNEKL